MVTNLNDEHLQLFYHKRGWAQVWNDADHVDT